jgi:cell division protein ZapE
LRNKGREIVVPEAAGGVARFAFADLCAKPLGASDYLTIAEAFPTIILSGVPILPPQRRNEAKRLINLIDTLYDRMVRLIVSAEAEPEALWTGKEGAETFEFRRTASRLVEMRSDAYWEAATAAIAAKEKARTFPSGPIE